MTRENINKLLLYFFLPCLLIVGIFSVKNLDKVSIKPTSLLADLSYTLYAGGSGENTTSLDNDPSLVGYWKFDGDNGTSEKDYSTFNNNFSFTQAGYANGVNGKAADLTKSFGYIPHSDSLSIDKELTISFWVYPRSLPATYASLFTKADAKGLNFVNYAAYLWGQSPLPASSGFTFWGGVSDAKWGALTPTAPVKLNTWQHVAFTFKNDVGGKIYINGAVDYRNDATKGNLSMNTGSIRIGGTGADVLIDDLKIFNRALKDNEVQALSHQHKKLLIVPLGYKSVNVGDNVSFQIIANCSPTCENGIQYEAQNIPTGAFFNSSTGLFSWTPRTNQQGVTTLYFTARSGELSDSTYVDIQVKPSPISNVNTCTNDSTSKCLDFGAVTEKDFGSNYNSEAMSGPVSDAGTDYRSILPKKNLKVSIPSFAFNNNNLTSPLFLEVRYKDTVNVVDKKADPMKVSSQLSIISDNPLAIKRELQWVASLGDKADGQWKTSSYVFQKSPAPLIRDINGYFRFEIYNNGTENLAIDFINLRTINETDLKTYLYEKKKNAKLVYVPIVEKVNPSSNISNRSLVLFYRDYMRPIFSSSKPSDLEINSPVKGLGFLGELETLNLGLYSDSGLNNLSVDVSDLVNKQGNTIRPDAKLFVIESADRRLGLGGRKEYSYIPDYLKPLVSLSLGKQEAKRVVVRVNIPKNADGGVYQGVFNIKEAGKTVASKEIELKVIPLTLDRPYTTHVLYHDPYVITPAMKFSEALKIYSEAEIEPWLDVVYGDFKLIDKNSAKYDISRFVKKIDELISGGVLKTDTPMVQVNFAPWDQIYTDMVGTINGRPVGASDAKYIYTDTPDLYDRLSHPDYIRGFKNILSAINDVAISRGLRFVYQYVDEPESKLDRLIIGDRLHTYTQELGLKTLTTGAPSMPTKLNQGGYTGSVSEMPPLSSKTNYNIADTPDGFYTTQSSFIRFPVYNRFSHGVYAFARNWTFLNAYALADKNQDPFDDFDYRPNGGYDAEGPDYILGYTTFDGGWLPTMSYEGMREGIRDDKYLTTLDKLVKSSKPSSPEEVAKVNSAKAYLENIKQKNSKLEWYKDFFWKLRPNGFYELILGAVSTKGEDDFEYFSDIRDKIASYIVDIKNVTVDLTPVAKSSSNGARGPSNGDTYVIPSSASGPYFDDMRANPNGSVLSSTTISTLATKSLKLNDKGDGVKSLKTFFRSRNYLESSNQSDVYDDKTIEAVKAFQKRFDIKGDVSGEVGSNTIQVLKTISAEIIKEPMSFVVPVIFGDKGKEVLKVKKVLVREGFLKKEDTGNELFDDKMLLAVKDFQIHYGLAKEGSPGFGSIGPNTRIVLNVLSRATLSGVVNKSYKISKTLYKGMRDNEVATLQEFLVDNKYMNLNTITNYFGSITHNALVKFQIDKKIISSPNDPGAGVVGPKTRKEIGG